MKTPKQAIAFVRATHKQQTKTGNSLASQKAKIEQYAGRHYLSIQTYFMCIGKISAEQLDEIITYCENHPEISTLIVQNNARISRDYCEFMFFKNALARHDVDVVTTDQCSTNTNEPMGRFMEAIQLMLEQFESEQRSMRVKQGLAKRMQQHDSTGLLG